MKATDVIDKYRNTDPKYYRTLQTILYNSNFDASKLIIETDKNGKRLGIKEIKNDFRDEYTRKDIIIV